HTPASARRHLHTFRYTTLFRSAPSGNHSNGTGLIENGIDLMGGSDLNRALAFTGMEPEPTVGTCAISGRPLTQVGPKGECLRCLDRKSTRLNSSDVASSDADSA